MIRRLIVPLALLAPAVAHAQPDPQPSANIIALVPANYAQYSPQTALDMALRTPGFALDEGNTVLRGFGSGAGNVLIDGQRPSSKTSVTEALARIPASQVERIELRRNVSTAEAQGQAVVLNVVRKPNATSGTWSVELERNANNVVYPRVEASRTATIAGWETSVRGRAYWEEFPFRRTLVYRDAAGQITSSVRQDLPSTVGEAYVSGEAKREVGGGTLTLNGRVGWFGYHYELPGQVWLGRLPGGEPDQCLVDTLGLDRMTYEVGADYVRNIGGWSWKALALLASSPMRTRFA